MQIAIPVFAATLVLSGLAPHTAAPPPSRTVRSDSARAWIHAAVEAIGGEDQLRAITTVSLSGIGHREMLEQSERPEGPWFVTYTQFTELRDFTKHAQRFDHRDRGYATANWWSDTGWTTAPATIVIDSLSTILTGGKFSRGSPELVEEADEALDLGPIHILLTALAATDLHATRDTLMHGFTHHIVAFTWHGDPVRIFLSGYTALPTAVEITRPRPYHIFWYPWGDVTSRTYFDAWTLEPGGIHYPREWTVVSNGQPDYVRNITALTFNAPLPADAFAIPDSLRPMLAAAPHRTADQIPLGLPNDPPQELAPGIVQVRGYWNIGEVRQDDGIVIIEGPISNGYSDAVMADARRRYPGLPIKAVVTTSDSWPHIGGLREYVARGIPIYALDLNRPILERLIAAPHRLRPDALARAPRAPRFHFVSRREELGRGANRMEIYPYRAPTGERQMMLYFPAHHLLYTSDLFAPNGGGTFFLPQYLDEAAAAVRRAGIAVDTVFGMHLPPTPWSAITAAIAKAVAPDSHPTQ